MTNKEYEEKLLALPIANQISGEHEEHTSNDPEFAPNEINRCKCDRCKIIRLKRMKALRFPRTKCKCGNLFTSIFSVCNECRNKE